MCFQNTSTDCFKEVEIDKIKARLEDAKAAF